MFTLEVSRAHQCACGMVYTYLQHNASVIYLLITAHNGTTLNALLALHARNTHARSDEHDLASPTQARHV